MELFENVPAIRYSESQGRFKYEEERLSISLPGGETRKRRISIWMLEKLMQAAG